MKAHRFNGDEFATGNKRTLPVEVEILNCYSSELDWDRTALWSRMLKVGVPDRPDISTVNRVFQLGYATEWVYYKMRRAYKIGLAERHTSNDPSFHIDPKRVPMIEHLDVWPSEDLKKRHYQRLKAEAEAKLRRKRSKKRKRASSNKKKRQ